MAHSNDLTRSNVFVDHSFSHEKMWGLDVKFVILQCLNVAGIVMLQQLAIGLGLAAVFFFSWQRKFGRREGVIALFCLACVLASSRELGLNAWKTLRLLPAVLLMLEAISIFRAADLEFRRRILRWGVLLVVLTALPALVSDFVLEGLEETLLLASMWPIMAIVAISLDEQGVRRRVIALCHFAVVVLLACAVVHFISDDVSMLKGRFRGVFGNPNELSHWLAPFALLVLAPSLGMSGKVKWGAFVSASVVFSMTGTRGAMLTLLLAVLGGWLIQAAVRRWLILTMLFVGFSVLLFAQFQIDDTLARFVPERFERDESVMEGGGRMMAWSHAWAEIQKRPVWGGGGGFEHRYFAENYKYFSMLDHEGMCHNSPLTFAMNYGVFAGLWLVYSLFNLLGLFKRDLWLYAAPAFLLSISVEGWLTAPMSAISPVFFFVSGLLMHSYLLKQT